MKSPWAPCLCGGKYQFYGSDESGTIAVYHTLPYCARYEAARSVHEMVRYSEENRQAAGIGGEHEPSRS